MKQGLLKKIEEMVGSGDNEIHMLAAAWFYTSSPTYHDYLYVTRRFSKMRYTKEEFQQILARKLKEYETKAV